MQEVIWGTLPRPINIIIILIFQDVELNESTLVQIMALNNAMTTDRTCLLLHFVRRVNINFKKLGSSMLVFTLSL